MPPRTARSVRLHQRARGTAGSWHYNTRGMPLVRCALCRRQRGVRPGGPGGPPAQPRPVQQPLLPGAALLACVRLWHMPRPVGTGGSAHVSIRRNPQLGLHCAAPCCVAVLRSCGALRGDALLPQGQNSARGVSARCTRAVVRIVQCGCGAQSDDKAHRAGCCMHRALLGHAGMP